MKNVFVIAPLLICLSYTFARGDTFGSGANTFNIDFVTIGNPGNAADTTGSPNPAGSVAYTYRIGTYEISRDMVTKANTLGNLGLTLNDLTAYGGNGVNRPANGTSWNEAARFVNWLNTSTGSAPAYKFAIQPGEPGYNTFQDILLWAPGDPGYNANNLFRNSLAHYFLPSVDEWYKAAFYDPTNAIYYDNPSGSNTAPTAVAGGTAPGTAVYNQPTPSGPADITLAGGSSPYGTMGQGGNLFEWEETEYDLVNDSSSSQRGVRSGCWFSGFLQLLDSYRDGAEPTYVSDSIGFRVASIPEPSTLLLTITAFATLLTIRRSRR